VPSVNLLPAIMLAAAAPRRSSPGPPAARSANVGEMTGRGTIYMRAVSSALIAFGFLAQVVTHLDPFVAAVLPAVFLLGEFTFAALVRNTLENLVLLRQMQRIRGYYRRSASAPEPVPSDPPDEQQSRAIRSRR
jgi:hypothetical protein